MIICRFKLFKSDIGTKHQSEACGIRLEFNRFSINAQQMYLLLLAARKIQWKMSVLQVWRFMNRIL